ncbi:molybdopterin-dependent oxidoreductase [Kitasatospora sp. YST-16]|uniref:molybdopterin-dependent oxidoreductase n=1 Tax=Kitasatospora sp. YST-16 TaxID=2998080 RepID=UPI002284F54B|nr:molybdopterin-dependent oxidoreductase [Kitasatospora sp. YST-16]WAL76616.1 molybdopterin-dependent oxidoreductase [Kitasatospora sp. YST-16]WNW42622.1 molybdopterin-dependent oxidoreductase [Streptomyces sp. Li-HN-5-13]
MRRGPFRAGAFRSPARGPRTAVVLGRWLGAALLLCFATGLVSHLLQDPPRWLLAVGLPTRPAGGYRVTQGLHVACGLAAVPLAGAKLWSVYPRLFEWPPARSVRHALERAAVAALVAAVLLELFTGLLNTLQWYPWPFPFRQTHYWTAWTAVGALLVHLAVKAPAIAAHWRRSGTVPLAGRRALLAATATAVGAVTLTTAGQSVPWLRALDLFAPRRPGAGGSALPVNRTAAQAGTATVPADWHLTVNGPTPYRLDLAALRALPQTTAVLPIACVEGWSADGRWTGVPLPDLLRRAGLPPGSAVRVTSLEADGPYRTTDVPAPYADHPRTLLALALDGRPLTPDHGFPARLIAPNRPGVLQTKWVTRIDPL